MKTADLIQARKVIEEAHERLLALHLTVVAEEDRYLKTLDDTKQISTRVFPQTERNYFSLYTGVYTEDERDWGDTWVRNDWSSNHVVKEDVVQVTFFNPHDSDDRVLWDCPIAMFDADDDEAVVREFVARKVQQVWDGLEQSRINREAAAVQAAIDREAKDRAEWERLRLIFGDNPPR